MFNLFNPFKPIFKKFEFELENFRGALSAKHLQSVARFKRFITNKILNSHSVTGIIINAIE